MKTWFGALPRKRVMLVVTPDSSMNARRAGSRFLSFSAQFFRAFGMPGRSCSLARSVFLSMSFPAGRAPRGWRARNRRGPTPPETPPRRCPATAASGLPLLLGLLRKPGFAPCPPVRQGDAAQASPLPDPFLDHAQRHAEPPGRRRARFFARVAARQDPLPQIQGDCFHPPIRTVPRQNGCPIN